MSISNHTCRGFALTVIIIVLQHQSFGQLQAGFTANPVSGCSPLVVHFSDQSTGTPDQWRWELGNGTISFLQNPSTTYFNPGTYTVKLVIRTANAADSVIKNHFITVYPNPVANFTASDSTGCFPLQVQFTDLSFTGSGTITNRSWDLGDGTLSTAVNPLHTYNTAGDLTVTLKVTNSFGCTKTFSKPQYIKINSGVTAGFTNTIPAECTAPADIQFTNTSSGDNTLLYNWDFGDGSSSTDTDPAHTYINNGAYTVTLIAVSPAGCRDTITKTNLITVGGINSWFISPDSICQDQPFTAMNTTTPPPVQAAWDFGDGSTSTQTNPVKVYTSPGTFIIKLVNQFTGCMDSVSRTIVVKEKPAPDFSADQTISCKTPFTVTFTNLTAGNNTYTWQFGDGSTSTGLHPVHIYNNEGSYTVTLIAINEQGCSDTIIKQHYIRIQRPVITISNLPRNGCIPLTITPAATVAANQPVATYLWDFGDGATSNLQTPSHTYTIAGTYDVSLIIETTGGCRDTLVLADAVRVGNKPDAHFSVNPSDLCAFQPVQFTDNSTGDVDQWLWDFGDGGVSSVQNPVYHYQDTGYFSVTLIVWSNTCADTVRINDIIHIRPPLARFTIRRDCADKYSIDLIDQSAGATAWHWDLGDGTTSTQRNLSHTYATTGDFQVTLHVSNGTCTHTMQQTIRIIDENADLTATTTLCKGMPADFTALHINPANIMQWHWDFGDGDTSINSLTASHLYDTAGLYTVTLIITDLLGCPDTSNIQVTVYGPAAEFSVFQPSICLSNDPVLFTDASTTDGIHDLVKWIWNYGDGTIDSVSQPPYAHLYTHAGTYDISLTVVDNYGCRDSSIKPASVIISQPLAGFHSPDTATCINKPVRFINSSAGNGLQYLWDFGDGQQSTDPAPAHYYSAVGLYPVSLVVIDQYGCTDSISLPLYINVSLPQAAFTVPDSFSTCPPLLASFINQSANYRSVRWDFGDGNTSVLDNPSHYYSLPGIYFPKLVVTGPGGCMDSTSHRIEVKGPRGSFSYAPVHGCMPLTVRFTAITSGSTSLTWDFSDGTTISSTDSVITHTYSWAGEFVPKMILHDASGCTVPVAGSDTIRVADVDAGFGFEQTIFCDSVYTSFHDSTISNELITGWQWYFGDGSSSNDQHPTHSFITNGIYDVKLVVTTETGCMDSLVLTSVVNMPEPFQLRVSPGDTICVGRSVQLSASGGYQYSWLPSAGLDNPAIASPRATPSSSTEYSVIANDSMHCFADTAIVFITVYPIPVVEAGPDETITVGSSIQLHATGTADISSWSWTPSSGLSCISCPDPIATPKQSIQYRIDVRNEGGCRAEDYLRIIVICKNGNVFIPNTFSPNGDGMNDRFYPRGKGLFTIRSLRIFNRWGEIVFEKFNFTPNDPAAGWDGRYKGRVLSPDVFLYTCEILCENNEIISTNGDITLLQ